MLSPSISKSSFRDCVEPRPPTPPKDISRAVDDAISFLDDSHEVERALTAKFPVKPPLQSCTPEPSSSPQRTIDSSTAASKRVDFSSTPIFHEPVKYFHSPVPHLQRRVRPLSDAKSARPLRSILKPGQPLLPPSFDELNAELYPFSPEEPGSFMKMLHSVISSLASSRQDQRLDAYFTLNGTLQKYDDSEEIRAMTSKMGIITQFIARDMAWKQENGSLDVNIVQQALKLTAAILSNPTRGLVACLDHDFRNIIIDRSIMMLETPGTPKAIVKLHLCLLTLQRFPSSNMTDAKADRIITALQTIEQRVTGNTAVITRLMIYNRLLEQCQDVMLRRAHDWFEQVLHCLLSHAKDMRVRALEACTTAGITLGADPNFTKIVRHIFETGYGEGENSRRYYEYFMEQLVEMYKSRETGPYVPQIFAAIVLCFRSKRAPIGSWSRCKNWLMIVQKCLNSGDIVTKTQAVIAWNKFVYALMPDSNSVLMLPMLKTPPANMFMRQNNDRPSKQTRELAMNIFCNTLHYTMRPGLSYEELDQAWDICIAPVFQQLLGWKGKGRINICNVMRELLTAKSGVWNDKIATENRLMTPADVPHLDARWVRLRLPRILAVLEPILQDTMWSSDRLSTESIDSTMTALFNTIAEAASQEIKTSNELKQAVALLTNLFDRLWLLGVEKSNAADLGHFYNRYNDLLSNAVHSVGPTAFAEDILVRNNKNGLEAALTPSSRPSKTHSVPHAPLVSLYGLLYRSFPDLSDNASGSAFSALALNILDLLTSTKLSPPAKLDLLNRSTRIWTGLYSLTSDARVIRSLWHSIAEHTIRILQDDHQRVEKESSQKLGHELRHAHEVLVAGFAHASLDPESLTVCSSLLNAMLDTAKQEAGAGGAALSVVEPFAKSLLAVGNSMTAVCQLRFATELVLNTTWPKTRQEVEESKFVLWNSTFGPQKRGVFEPFEYLYTFLTTLSTRAYETVPTESGDLEVAICGFFDALLTFVSLCPTSLVATALRRLHGGFTIWVEDKSRKAPAGTNVSNKVCKFWHKLLAVIETIPQRDSNLLAGLENILIAGLSSPRKAIVNETIIFWNTVFGVLDAVEYPKQLEAVLFARSRETELFVPALTRSLSESDLPELPSLYESQEDDPLAQSSAEPSPDNLRTYSVVPGSAPTRNLGRLLSFSPMPRAGAQSSPARPTARSSAVSTPKARLRHDDSQIQFAQIDADSSPIRFEETQNLTEHQKEVTERQKQDATLYPELSSSSPIVKPRALPRSLQKRLELLSQGAGQDQEAQPTPEEAVDIGNILTDEIPSSPTPSSAKGSDYSKHLQDDDQMEDDAPDEEQHVDIDPPSSPPSSPPQVDDDEHVVGGTHRRAPSVETDPKSTHGVDATTVVDETTVFDEPMSDTPDDVRQLRTEEDAALSQRMSQSLSQAMAEPEQDDNVEEFEDEGTVVDSQDPQPKQRKRKRKSKGFSSSKKRKSVEPVPSSNVYEMDDDIGDEIVVAGSQNRPSPEPETEELDDLDVPDEKPPTLTSTPMSTSSTAKRRRRRSKQRLSSSPSTVIEATFASTSDGPVSATSSPAKGRRNGEQALERRVEDSQIVPDTMHERKPVQVVPSTSDLPAPRRRTIVEIVPTPPKRLDVAQRSTATPNTLLSRLQDVLTELPNVSLNALEDRRLQRVLNQLMNGVYEARERALEEEEVSN